MLGFLIVAMSMVGLANAITMSILERTREIGILRCIGARARDIRRIFATEGVALALARLAARHPARLRAHAPARLAGLGDRRRAPPGRRSRPGTSSIALVGTLALALLVLLLPLRRAVRFRPGRRAPLRLSRQRQSRAEWAREPNAPGSMSSTSSITRLRPRPTDGRRHHSALSCAFLVLELRRSDPS